MSDKGDEISLKEAAELTGRLGTARPTFEEPTDEAGARLKREREVGNAGATLDALLAASRHEKTVR